MIDRYKGRISKTIDLFSKAWTSVNCHSLSMERKKKPPSMHLRDRMNQFVHACQTFSKLFSACLSHSFFFLFKDINDWMKNFSHQRHYSLSLVLFPFQIPTIVDIIWSDNFLINIPIALITFKSTSFAFSNENYRRQDSWLTNNQIDRHWHFKCISRFERESRLFHLENWLRRTSSQMNTLKRRNKTNIACLSKKKTHTYHKELQTLIHFLFILTSVS